jgi:threonine dehydrogenase-like Zn-dependent dehydrogenase
MKAIAVFPAKRSVEIVDHPEPRIGSPTDVKLRMLEAGVCGTDREICAFEYGTPPFGSPYLIIGHESLAEVAEVGAGVTRVRPGDLVVPMVRRPCIYDHCVACRADRQDFCYTGHFSERGIKGLHGFMSEIIVDDQKYMNVVPAALRDVAVLIEPLTIAEKAIAQIWQVQQRLPWACPVVPGRNGGHCHSAVVLGAGPVGLLGAMAMVANDFETYIYSRELPPNPKAELAEAIGAHYVSAQTHSPQQLAEVVGNVDVVYEATGASSVSFEMMKVIGKNGIFVFTGVPGRKAPIEVDTDLIMRNLVLNNQVVFGTVNADRDAFESAVRDLQEFMHRWPAAVRSLITARQPMSAYEQLLTAPPQGIKNVIVLQG